MNKRLAKKIVGFVLLFLIVCVLFVSTVGSLGSIGESVKAWIFAVVFAAAFMISIDWISG